MSEDVWLECDDEVIRVLRMRELEDLLSRKSRTSALTAYTIPFVLCSGKTKYFNNKNTSDPIDRPSLYNISDKPIWS
jgi:hypothetical protein